MSINDEDKLDQNLAVPMTKAQVLDALGKADDVLIDDGHTIVWQYNFYRRNASLRNLPWILCWGIGLVMPIESRSQAKLVVLVDDQLCRWGNPSVVRTRNTCMAPLQSKVNMSNGKSAPALSGTSFSAPNIINKLNQSDLHIKIQPLLVEMPLPIKSDVRRIAIIHPAQSQWLGLPRAVQDEVKGMIEKVVFSLHSRLPRIEIVERTDLDMLTQEQYLQASGRIRDQDFAGVGRMMGADHLLTYSLTTTGDDELLRALRAQGGMVSVSASFKLLSVETGSIVYQDTVFQAIYLDQLSPSEESTVSLARRAAIYLALTGLHASIYHALVPDEIGLVIDPTFGGSGAKIFMVLVNSPAARIGLKADDTIVKINGRDVAIPEDVDRMHFSEMKSITLRRGDKDVEYPVTPGRP